MLDTAIYFCTIFNTKRRSPDKKVWKSPERPFQRFLWSLKGLKIIKHTSHGRKLVVIR